MIKAGFYQFNPLFGEVEKNLMKVIEKSRITDAELIV